MHGAGDAAEEASRGRSRSPKRFGSASELEGHLAQDTVDPGVAETSLRRALKGGGFMKSRPLQVD